MREWRFFGGLVAEFWRVGGVKFWKSVIFYEHQNFSSRVRGIFLWRNEHEDTAAPDR